MMFEIKVKMFAAKQKVHQLLKVSYLLNKEGNADSATSVSQRVPYRQAKQARLKAELRIAEAYAWHWRRKNRMI